MRYNNMVSGYSKSIRIPRIDVLLMRPQDLIKGSVSKIHKAHKQWESCKK